MNMDRIAWSRPRRFEKLNCLDLDTYPRSRSNHSPRTAPHQFRCAQLGSNLPESLLIAPGDSTRLASIEENCLESAESARIDANQLESLESPRIGCNRLKSPRISANEPSPPWIASNDSDLASRRIVSDRLQSDKYGSK